MEKKYLQLIDIQAYIISFSLSNHIWKIMIKWDYFAKDTVGKQWARSIDSISANIAEGFGRFGKKDKIKFYRYSSGSGSIKEPFDWLSKAKIRSLINQQEYKYIYSELNKLPKEINSLIKFTNNKLKI